MRISLNHKQNVNVNLDKNFVLLRSDTDYEVIREGDRGVRKSDLRPSEGGGKIIGTIAVCVKEDPDMRDPPGKPS